MTIEVFSIKNDREMQAFDAFPRKIYRNFFRTPSFPAVDWPSRKFSDILFQAVDAQPLLAFRNGQSTGRLAVSINHTFSGKDTGFFGYFESLNDPETTAALFQAATQWLSDRDIKRMIGPVDLTPHERLGLLIKGFRGFHLPGMPYNPPYYSNLIEQLDIKIEVDLFAYKCDLRRPIPDRLVRITKRALLTKNLLLREINFSNLAGEGEIFSKIHNGSMDAVWGFAPLNSQEGSAIWKKIKNFCDPSLIIIAEIDRKPAGLCLILCPARRPVSSNINTARLAVLAVLPQFRFKGLEAAMIVECARRARNRGIGTLELSQVAENNPMMNRIIQSLSDIRKDKIYRIYKLDFQ
ncbi:MAG: GNAT family N-acetyltransferase [Desulfotomaculaceae bacterium]|nr:GNAT family N-acetyltransferase [Desulfotomaculaceae bacterium]